MNECYIFDLDGTLADCSHRRPYIQINPKDWDSFFARAWADKPIAHMILVAQRLSTYAQIVYVSGRSDVCRSDTLWWLNEHCLPEGPLYMRKNGDRRPDYQVKREILEEIRAWYTPIMAFDDRSSVVEMWRANGVPCAQVAEGDF
jgi:FMN phosphatase YigB (HAD superfamily)